MQFSGTVNEPVTATVGGNPVTVVAAGNGVYNWKGSASVTAAPSQQPNKIPLVGTDTNGHQTKSTINVTVTGNAARIPKYDLNGNLTDDGAGKTYGYDAANRMVKITQASGVTGFVYDGKGRRVQETLNGALIKQWIWCGGVRPCEERNASNTVTKRFYVQGEQLGGVNYYFTRDHLGSVREMTNASGSLVARYDFDPYGRRTLVSGTDLADFGFTGDYYHAASGLNLTLYRAYDANLGRWLSRDPVQDVELSREGTDLYWYVKNNPINAIDPTGQGWLDWLPGFIIDSAERAADEAMSRCDTYKCRQPCEKCCTITALVGLAGIQAAYYTSLFTACSAANAASPVASVTCVLAMTGIKIYDLVKLSKALSECKAKCAQKPTNCCNK